MQKLLFCGSKTTSKVALLFKNNKSLYEKYKISDINYQLLNSSNRGSYINRIRNSKCIEDADVIVFEENNNNNIPNFLKSKNLYSKYKNDKILIPIPSLNWNGYLTDSHKNTCIIPYIFLWLRSLGKNLCEIRDWLDTSTCDSISDLIEYKIECSLNEMVKHHNILNTRYGNLISTMDIIETHKNNLICTYPKIPTSYYINELSKKIINKIDSKFLDIDLTKNYQKHENIDAFKCIYGMHFWKKYFNELKVDFKILDDTTPLITKSLDLLKQISTHQYIDELSILV